MKIRRRKNKGITLIALVVTIVVLLILAAVSISMLTGENGIITQAQKSKEQSVIGEEKEAIALAFSNCKGENLSNMSEAIVTDVQLQNELEKNGENVNVTMEIEDLVIEFLETEHKYSVNQDGQIAQEETLTPEEAEKIIEVVGNYNNNVWVLSAGGKVKLYTGLEYGIFKEIEQENNTEVITEKGILKKGYNWFIDKEGKVYTWGENSYGQLGNGTNEEANKPICISDIDGNALKDRKITEVYSDVDTMIAIDSEGRVYTWGENSYGQLGNGTNEGSNKPICISDIEGNALKDRKITEVYTYGNTMIAIDSEGKVYTWGQNYHGELGDGTTEVGYNKYREIPICISDIEGNALKGKNITNIYSNSYTMIAIDSEGRVYAWGENDFGQLGNGTNEGSNKPICISDIEGNALKGRKITEVYCGDSTVIALDSEGKVYTWGHNYYGELGDGITAVGYYKYREIPICISDIEENALKDRKITNIYIERNTIIAIDDEGRVYTWGWNRFGKLGDETEVGSNKYRDFPRCLNDIETHKLYKKKVKDISYSSSFYITEDGDVYYINLPPIIE